MGTYARSVGIESQTLTGLTVENPAESLNLIKDALGKNKSDKGEKAANMIALNAGAVSMFLV
jgi:anthranilate phosphoribosyltransferase